jgi:hypothetical protein
LLIKEWKAMLPMRVKSVRSVVLNTLLSLFLPVLVPAAIFCSTAQAQGFKFSNPDPADAADQAAQAQRDGKTQAQLATPCRARIKNQKIMVLLAEERNGSLVANQNNFGRHVDAINNRLKALGLKTYTAAQIRAQVAQAEIDAYFKNNPDAALSASRRLAAAYVLRGLVTSRAERNAIVNVNQVYINMDFMLTTSGGAVVSQAKASNASYAGSDTTGMALTLIEERAEEVVAQLYSDYCRKAGGK